MSRMKEIEKEGPNYFQMALDEMDLTDEQKQTVNMYGHIMFLTAISYFDNPENDDKVFTLQDFRVYADKEYPEGWELMEKVLKKAEELENSQGGIL